MTVGTFPGTRQSLAYTVRAKDDCIYFSKAQQTLAYTVKAKDDRMYFSGAQEDHTFHF